MSEKEHDKKQIEVTLPDELTEQHFANMVTVSHTPHNFSLDFIQVAPVGFDRVAGRVVTRAVLPPTVAVRLAKVLARQISQYEERYGCIPALSLLAPEGEDTRK